MDEIRRLVFGRDANTANVPVPGPSNHITSYRFRGNQREKTVQVPEGATYAGFSATRDFWAKWGDTEVDIPNQDIVDGSAPQLNPGAVFLAGMTVFTVAMAQNGWLCITWYG